MDLINGIIPIISGGASNSSLEGTSVNRITFFTIGRYFLCNDYYPNNISAIPKPILEYDYNTYIYFISNTENTANIDWGDGSEKEYNFSKLNNGTWILGFRSLSCDFKKAPGSNFDGRYLSSGERWIPEPPKDYGSSGNRKVVITFSNEITQLGTDWNRWSEFPIIENPGITLINVQGIKVSTIPFNRFSGMNNLRTLSLRGTITSRMDQFPESLKDCKSLTSFNAVNIFDFNDINNSGLRDIIKEMKSLTSLNISGNYLKKYLKEFNDLPNLSTLYFGTGGVMPDFSEVDKINPSIRYIRSADTWGNGNGSKLSGDPTGWMEWYNGKGMENVQDVGMYAQDSFLDVEFLPQWIHEARSLTTISMAEGFRVTSTTDYIDTYINTIYQETIKHPMSSTDTDGKRNQWYGLNLTCWNSARNYGIRPSGTLKAPSGFVRGSSNGNPQSALEKVYVFKNNYSQKWTLKPE